MINWFYKLLTLRNLQTTCKKCVLKVITNMGFLQGGVCSAKFWIAFDKAAEILSTNGVSGELFADDGNRLIGTTDIVRRDLSNWEGVGT